MGGKSGSSTIALQRALLRLRSYGITPSPEGLLTIPDDPPRLLMEDVLLACDRDQNLDWRYVSDAE